MTLVKQGEMETLQMRGESLDTMVCHGKRCSCNQPREAEVIPYWRE